MLRLQKCLLIIGLSLGFGGSAWAAGLPDVALRDENDSSQSLAAITRGHYTLLNLWATWCAPCRREMPGLQKLQADLGRQLAVIPVSVEAGKLDRVASFYRLHAVTGLPLYLLDDRDDMVKLKVLGLPTTILLDPQGEVVWRIAGDLDWNDAQLRRKLQQDLTSPAIPTRAPVFRLK